MSDGQPLLHLLHEAVWQALPPDGVYEPASLALEGFVHCTADDALLLRVANAFYRREPGPMVALSIDPAGLTSAVRWEAPPEADPLATERFPHVYGPLDLRAVVAVRPMIRHDDGTYVGFGAALPRDVDLA